MFRYLMVCCWLGLLGSGPAAAVELPPAMPLAKSFDDRPRQIPLTEYWVSEKLDGVRAIWDGQALYTRAGNRIVAPEWFVRDFPTQPLDGELWIGRGQFEQVSGTVRQQQPVEADWRKVSYQLFELPEAAGTYTQRLQLLQQLTVERGIPWLKVIPQRRVTGQADLDNWLRQIVAMGGEGLMLHRADAVWVAGRTDALLKYKLFEDAEATVLGYEPGKGRFAGQVGALRVQLPDGQVLRLGSGLSEADRRHPPAIGAQITYRYRGLTRKGLPRFATYWRVRPMEGVSR